MRRSRIGCGLAAVLLAGCAAVGPDFVAPQPVLPAAYREAHGPAPTPQQLAAWWQRFRDPQLDRLVAEALAANHDLAAAEARVREARALREATAGRELPALNASASVLRSRESAETLNGQNLQRAGEHLTNNLLRAGVDAGWEIDLFGGVRRAVEAADADAVAAEAQRLAVQVTVAADTAGAWLDLRGLARELAAVQRNLDAQRASWQVVRDRQSAGMAADLDLARAEAQVASTAAALPPLRAAMRQNAYRLEILTGHVPGSDTDRLLAAAPLAASDWPDPPAGVPAELLRRRPDLLRAEAELAAASARVGVAEADLYPKLTLTGTLGLAATQAGNFGNAGARTWSFGPGLSLPIFEGGRLRSVVTARAAALDGARARYEQTVLAAVGEVESAAATLTETRARRAALVQSLAALRRALGHADDRYRAGVSSFLDVLDAQRAQFATEIEVARADRELAAAQVRLHKALGQGW